LYVCSVRGTGKNDGDVHLLTGANNVIMSAGDKSKAECVARLPFDTLPFWMRRHQRLGGRKLQSGYLLLVFLLPNDLTALPVCALGIERQVHTT
jgi:hypothetical protein